MFHLDKIYIKFSLKMKKKIINKKIELKLFELRYQS